MDNQKQKLSLEQHNKIYADIDSIIKIFNEFESSDSTSAKEGLLRALDYTSKLFRAGYSENTKITLKTD